MDNIISQGFIPHITKPTRITLNSANHVYSNHNHPNYESGIIITDDIIFPNYPKYPIIILQTVVSVYIVFLRIPNYK